MSKFNRILIILLIILTLGVLVELGYYIIVTSRQNTVLKSELQTPESVQKSNSDNTVKILSEKANYAEASYLRNILMLNYELKAFSGLSLTSDIRGTVSAVDNDGGFLDPQTPYELSISILLPGRKDPLPIYYTKEDAARISYTPATASGNIKPGDTVSIKETYDLVDFHLVKGEISKIN